MNNFNFQMHNLCKPILGNHVFSIQKNHIKKDFVWAKTVDYFLFLTIQQLKLSKVHISWEPLISSELKW